MNRKISSQEFEVAFEKAYRKIRGIDLKVAVEHSKNDSEYQWELECDRNFFAAGLKLR